MIHAELHRKFTSNEDQFTSTVLGLLSYLAPADGMLRLLSHACPMGRDGLGRLFTKMDIPTGAEAGVLYWPRTRRFGDPDVLVVVRVAGEVVRVIVIEAKLGSSKAQWTEEVEADEPNDTELESSAADLTDQLARYWQALKGGGFADVPRLRDEQYAVVYLTNHTLVPIDDLRETCRRAPDIRLGWLSWDEVWRIANELASTAELGRTERAIALDLRALLGYRGFGAFCGFDLCNAPLTQQRWRFEAAISVAIPAASIDFTLALRFGVPGQSKWRFVGRHVAPQRKPSWVRVFH